MRHVATWGLAVVIATVCSGCGGDSSEGAPPQTVVDGLDDAERTEPAAPAPDEVERKALAMLRDFVEQGGDVNETLAESHLLGEPAMDVNRLHVAAERGWLSVVRYLVEHGASVGAIAPSKSHYNQLRAVDVARHAGHPHVVAYLEQVGDYDMIPMGSSLKFCVVAEGGADLYPRLGPTSEWDTAAAQAVVEQAGGKVVTLDGKPMKYNAKADILNPHFFVVGATDRDWLALLPASE